MKTLTYSIFFILAFVLFQSTSCVKPQTYLEAYYNFRGDDLDKLLDFEVDQEISFQNNLGEILTYQVESVTDNYKKQRISGGGNFLGFPVPESYYFYYDRKTISFNVNQGMYNIEYDFRRYPIDEQQAMNNSYSELSSEFIGYIFFINWNGEYPWSGISSAGSSEAILIDYEAEIITMNINGIVYNNVIEIASGNPNPLINGVIVRTVNVIYFDKQHGVIGFDETDGKEWRIMN